MASDEILQLQHQMRMQQRLYEANIKSLTADLNAAYIDVDRKQELLSDLEKKSDIQAEELEITKQHFGRVQDKATLYEKECSEKAEEVETLRGVYTDTKKKLNHTTERPQELEFLKEYLDTSFDAQSYNAAAQKDACDDNTTGSQTRARSARVWSNAYT